ncbi:Cytochrome b-c1 complex subunit 9, mitochondrial [Exophiala xenobiotica]|uniref:Complex III subunit 9 n=1 Tax=Vermiconidia calcicola TaxID=1690605 RepID=A0AAV9Q0K5_9PEZI|nr:Cytochrome b-c1 complex subunit 9, mitochondrial [Exophiala xenobiotica]KAK5531475.1 Cytochrome b-c1 complex subunit 9, mitochondrial [Vermiconidia calcicola]KAK5544738.1 Cytochrome b-c1 complex subunit 9, mitochondrial [Chaetothyriales sp. CCFEE 6169]KAK5207075.1 Cytochrome b-c1 complex subunit 9, mitochondrial [Exophiala xenobiotica]KAK5218214.1 Cytochrome b-c1 complex subunit 9, mitochondrial [Exophiala xenobiotica]
MSLGARISSGLFNGIFRRNAAFLTTVFAGAFAFEIAFESGTNAMWDTWNKGRQWKDIKQKYLTAGDDDEEE